MAVYNAITGLKRKLPRYNTPRKKRQTACSTVASRMYGQHAFASTKGFQGIIFCVWYAQLLIGVYGVLIISFSVFEGSFFFASLISKHCHKLILIISVFLFLLVVFD